MQKILVRINGHSRLVNPETTILDIIRSFELSPETTLVEKNGVAVDSKEYSQTRLANEDHISLTRVVVGR